MSKYKIIITLILFCLFQTTPSISLELKIPKDLKKLGDAVKKELEKNKGKKKSKKTKKKEVDEDKKISTTNNNYIYYSDVVNDKYFRKIGFFKRGKGARKVNLTNFSYIVKSPDKDYEVEYIAAIESEKKDAGWTVYSGNFTAINLKTEKSKTYKFSAREDSSSFEFLESSLFLEIRNGRATWYQYSGMTCKNEQNPQCMKRLAEVNIIGFRDLKNNLTYAEFISNYKKKVVEEKRIAEEKRIEEEKKQAEKDRIYAEEQKQRAEQRRIEEEAAEKRRAEQQAIANKPENLLYDAYGSYIAIKKFYDASSVYYVSGTQMREAKKQIKAIEKALVEKDNTMNTDSIWERAVRKIESDMSPSTMSIAATNPTAQFQGYAKLMIMGLTNSYNEIIGPKKTEKDF